MPNNVATTETECALSQEDLFATQENESEVTEAVLTPTEEWVKVNCDLEQIVNGLMLAPNETRVFFTVHCEPTPAGEVSKDREEPRDFYYLRLQFKGINKVFLCRFKTLEQVEKFAKEHGIDLPKEEPKKANSTTTYSEELKTGLVVNDTSLWKDFEQFNLTYPQAQYETFKKVFYVSEFSEPGAFFHIAVTKDDDIQPILADSQCSARIYYQCKENNIALEYKNDDKYFHNVIDLHSEMEREVQVENAFSKFQKAIDEESNEEIENALAKYQKLVDGMVETSDPVTVMFKLVKEFQTAHQAFTDKYKDTPDIEIPEDAKDDPKLLEEKYPEIYAKVKEGGEQYIKDCEALKLAETKLKIAEAMNKQLIAETQSQYNFDTVYAKLQKFLANAQWNKDKNAEFLYTTMLKSYDQSITLEPMMAFEEYSHSNPGKTFYTMYDQYDKVVNRVRGRMEREPQFNFIDPIIIIPRIKAIIEENPEEFFNFSSKEGAILFYYLFCKTIDNSKKDYVKENGLFILKLTQHFAHFFDGKDPLSRREELLSNIKKILKLIREDMSSLKGLQKYGKVYKGKDHRSFLAEQFSKFEAFAQKKRKEYAKKAALKNLTERSMVEEEDNPLAPQSEDTE